MSYNNQYQQYSGNPYGQAEQGYGGSNPYGGTGGGYGSSNPYGGAAGNELNAPPALQHEESNYSQASQYSQPGAPPPMTHGAEPLSQQDFLARIEGVNRDISQLSSSIGSIATIHQKLLSAPDSGASSQLESIVTNTQILNTRIKDQIKFLEKDASRAHSKLKDSQVSKLKTGFKNQLEDFQREERDYEHRYRDAIARQYRIVNPEATQAEVDEAANANWGDEGIFQTALKSNRSGQASSVLGAVRARHNDIQRIEKTLGELALLFQQLNEQVVFQEEQVKQTELQTENVHTDATHANKQLDKGVESARRARRLKWYTLWVVVAILCIVALALGLYFGLPSSSFNKNKNNNA